MSAIIKTVHNFEALLTSDTQKKAFAKISKYCKDNTIALGKHCELNNRAIAGQAYYVSLGSLITALDNPDFQQFELQVNKVLAIFTDPILGLMFTRTIEEDITVGYASYDADGVPLDAEMLELVGGRHRTVARLLCYYLSGHDITQPEVQEILIKANPKPYSANAVLASNGSRAVTKEEKTEVKFSLMGITRDTESIVDAMLSKKITVLAGWQAAFAAMAELEECPVTRQTAAKIGGYLQTQLKSAKTSTGKRFVIPVASAAYAQLVEDTFSLIPEGVKYANKNGVTNIARNGCDLVAQYISDTYSKKPRKALATIAPVASARTLTEQAEYGLEELQETAFALSQLTHPLDAVPTTEKPAASAVPAKTKAVAAVATTVPQSPTARRKTRKTVSV